jgi:hypothetical protein
MCWGDECVKRLQNPTHLITVERAIQSLMLACLQRIALGNYVSRLASLKLEDYLEKSRKRVGLRLFYATEKTGYYDN